MPQHPLQELLGRFTPDFLGRRMQLQVDYYVRVFGAGRGGPHLENMDFLFPVLDRALRLVRLRRRALRNTLSLRARENVFRLPGLPPAFDGLRLLHLSDLHLDCAAAGEGGLARPIVGWLDRAGLRFDLCLITGDFRYKTHGSYLEVAEQMALLMPALRCRHGVYGVLGNHDFIEEVPYLERLGLRLLVNEAAPIRLRGKRLWLVGVDDPHFYGTHDLGRAMAPVSSGEAVIALVHSPEIAEEAARCGVSLYLAGHTHGGQVCLPGGIPVYLDAHCPRRRARGRWRCGAMQGYTSAGAGCSGLLARLNCPPEVAIHVLRRD